MARNSERIVSHLGPMNSHTAELRADSDAFFQQVHDFIDAEAINDA